LIDTVSASLTSSWAATPVRKTQEQGTCLNGQANKGEHDAYSNDPAPDVEEFFKV
jgi:hypothetical protein